MMPLWIRTNVPLEHLLNLTFCLRTKTNKKLIEEIIKKANINSSKSVLFGYHHQVTSL